MITKPQMKILLENLTKVIKQNIPGDIVELGCNMGTAALFFTRVLQELNSKKELYLYDSFSGLPEKKSQDISEIPNRFIAGSMAARQIDLKQNFINSKLPIPKIYEGWFKDIPDENYPNPIAFAFFDGDFYDSILDSFNKVYTKVSKGGIICVHDYGWPSLPGAKIATDEFITNKNVILEWDVHNYICTITKNED
jgi:O-methyltransferase